MKASALKYRVRLRSLAGRRQSIPFGFQSG